MEKVDISIARLFLNADGEFYNKLITDSVADV